MDVKGLLAVLGEPGIRRTSAGVTQEFRTKLRNALATLMAMVNEGRCKDDENYVLASSVAKVLPSHDLVVKRLACILLTRWRMPDVGLLVYNTLRKDCMDANPLIRSLAFRTLLHRNFIAFREPNSERELLILGLEDSSAHVRRTAVLGCAHHSTLIDDHNQYFADRLYAMLRDPDPLVVVNCLTTLDQLLRSEGGVVVNRGIVKHLLSRMSQMSDFDVVRVLCVLGRRYTPESEDDTFSLMDSLDPLLQRQNSAVVYETTQLFLRLVGSREEEASTTTGSDMRSQVFRRIAPRVTELLVDSAASCNAEIQYLWLCFVRENHVQFSMSRSLSRVLHCEYGDPVCIKVVKIELSTLLVEAHQLEDARLILDELFAHCTSDRSDMVSSTAVRALGQLAVRIPHVANQCVATLVRLLALNSEATRIATLLTLCQLDMATYLQQPHDLRLIDFKLQKAVQQSTSSCTAGSKSALIRFLGIHGHLLECGPYLLEELMNEVQNADREDDEDVQDDEQRFKEALLVSGFRMLFTRPAEMQLVLGRYAEHCYADGTGDLARRVRFYFRLLRSDLNLAKRIICNDD